MLRFELDFSVPMACLRKGLISAPMLVHFPRNFLFLIDNKYDKNKEVNSSASKKRFPSTIYIFFPIWAPKKSFLILKNKIINSASGSSMKDIKVPTTARFIHPIDWVFMT